MTTSTDIEEFLDSPLVTWLRSCLDDSEALSDYDDLADGVLIHQVLLLIDPEPLHHGVGPSLGNPALRTRNMDCIVKNIKALYEEELCQLVVVLPDCGRLGREPDSKEGLQEMHLLLLLLLGCAVQCPNKQTFIEQIKLLPIDAQHSLVHCIKQVTESQEIVLTQETGEGLSSELLISHIRRLIKQRDNYLQTTSTQEDKKQSNAVAVESQHLAVEVADWKAKLRKHRQELEEKSESLVEAREELEHNKTLVVKLRNEITELKAEARACKTYRDEADILRERAERCDKLESEIVRYRERLADLEYYRVRVEELRQDNRVLEDTREMLEEQLSRARSRVQYTMQLEADLLQQKQTINELSLEKEANQEKLQELFEENAQLTLLSKSALLQDNSSSDVDQVDETSTADNSLSEQLSSNAQARALRLELENKRLASTVENLQEAALQQTNERVLQLEKDKKKLSLQVEEIEESKRKLQLHISELENTVKNAQRDTKKMQEIRDSLQAQIQSRIDEVESVTKEKLKLENRLLEAERALEKAKIKEEQLEELAEVKAKVVNMEKEITRLKDTLEVNSIAMDKLQCETETISKEKLHLISQVEDARNQISRLQEVERELKDLDSKYEVEKATIVTLQRDLVAEKLNTQQMKLGLEKLGLPADYLTDPDNALDRIVSNPGVLKAVRERLAQEQSSSQTEAVNSAELATVNAQLEVNVSTLQSQIASLTSQHTALQLANSQLAAEKDEVAKELDSLRREHQQLLVDQLTLQGLHEQLGSEYESLVKDRDTLKGTVRESRVEARGLKDSLDRLSAALTSLQQERDCLRAETNSLNNLRAEHSKLKDDFRNLFTANEKAKSEYRGAQEEYRTMRSEVRKLTLNVTELQGVIATRDDRITHLEIELSKLHSQCGMLKQVTSNLEEDRRSLMEHVTLLLGQYHELLTHSLEDKEHYHLEEKMFTDKLNNLCRQKEKLEEKIMEHYRRMESCPAKKKGFGANMVRKIRKAGSDLINKSRKSWHEDSARRGTDSDTSLEDVRTRQDGLGLSTPGTRRTVYLSGDENSASTNDQDESKTVTDDVPRSSTPQQSEPSLLVYNRVTTVLGNSTPPPQTPNASRETGSRRQSSKSNNIWLEYGCV